MLLWAKAAARRVKDEARAAEAAEIAAGLGLSSIRPEQLDQARIEDLVAANLSAKLDILHPDDLAQALHQFVEKEEKAALADCVTRVLQHTQGQVVSCGFWYVWNSLATEDTGHPHAAANDAVLQYVIAPHPTPLLARAAASFTDSC
jgi:hypothetical protein